MLTPWSSRQVLGRRPRGGSVPGTASVFRSRSRRSRSFTARRSRWGKGRADCGAASPTRGGGFAGARTGREGGAGGGEGGGGSGRGMGVGGRLRRARGG